MPGSSIRYTGAGNYPGVSIARFRDTNDFGIHGVNGGGPVDSQNGRAELDGNSTGNGSGAEWGVVIGNAFTPDPNAGPCTNGVIEGLDVHTVQQEPIKCAETGTENIVIACNMAHNSGLGLNFNNNEFFGEGIYYGQGSGGGAELLDNMDCRGNWVFDLSLIHI